MRTCTRLCLTTGRSLSGKATAEQKDNLPSSHSPAGLHLARQAGFTLIEVLMVIAIIGVLVGLLVPAVNIARRKVQQSSIVFEVQTLANSIEQYKTNYGEYPPDGSSVSVFKRHLRDAFPNMAPTELADLDVAVGCNQLPTIAAAAEFRVMDPSEALVFFLGGFSDDPIHPFTGPGGPLQVLSRNAAGVATSVQYNVDRNNPIFQFKQAQLTLEVVSGLTVSVDEALYALPPAADGSTADVMPAYHPSGRLAPYVYFDSRTYAATQPGIGTYVNHFSPGTSSPVTGFARPYKSDQVNTSVSYASAPDSYYRYANDRSFQIVSAGLDDAFGNVNPLAMGTSFFVYPSGQLLDISIPPGSPQPGALAYVETNGQPSAQLDNAANFADGILGDGLDN